MCRFYLILAVGLLSLPIQGQSSLENEGTLKMDSVALTILTGTTDSIRMSSNKILLGFLKDTLASPASFNLPFDEFKSISRLKAPDEKFFLWTWQLPRKGGVFHHQGLLILPGETENRVIELIDTTDQYELPFYKPLKVENWEGCIYYHIEKVKKKGETFYTLIGYDQHNLRTRRKWIDVLSFSGEEEKIIRFGADIFKVDKFQGRVFPRKPYRLVMEYSAKYSAMLRWEDKEERMIMDHLEPQDASMKKMYNFYGPDFTYDALEWKKGNWELEGTVEIESDIQTPIRPPSKGVELSPEDEGN